MAVPKRDEPVYFYEWDETEEKHFLYDAVLRVVISSPNNKHPKVHLTVLGHDEVWRNVNNVENVEYQDDMTGLTYWRHRYGAWPLA